MAATRLVMRQEVIRKLGNPTGLDSAADLWVQRAYQHITQSIEFPEAEKTTTIATVVGTRNYAKPTDYYSIYSLRDNTNNRKLIQISTDALDALSTVPTGAPTHYALTVQGFEVYPSPDAVVTLQMRYRKIFAELLTDATTHDLLSTWDEVIIMKATAFGYTDMMDIERARHAHAEAGRMAREQERRLSADLIDRDEAIIPVGIHLTGALGRTP